MSLAALALCLAVLPDHGLAACRLAPWAVEGAAEARTWTREPVTPELMLAIVAVETGGTFRVRIVGGRGGKFCGPWQVHPRWTGMTCRELQGQPGAMAAGRIIGRFARRGGGLREALRRYSGSATDYTYSDRVLEIAAGF